MGIRFLCPNGHKLNVKSFQAGKRAICPECGAKVVVPATSEVAAAESPQSIVAPAKQVTDTASPSIVISIAESTTTSPPKLVEPSPALKAQPIPPPNIPESIVIAPSQPESVIEPVALAPEAQYQMRRERNRRNQLLFAVFLLTTTVVLAFVLIWVLRRDAGSSTGGQVPPAKTNSIARSLFCDITACNCWQSAPISRI